MREKRTLIRVLTPLTILSLLFAVVFNYITHIKDAFVVDVCLAIFRSTFFSLIVTVIGFYSDKRKILKEYGDILIDVLNTFCGYRFLAKNKNTAKNNLEILLKIESLTLYSLSNKYYEYSPMKNSAKSNLYIYFFL